MSAIRSQTLGLVDLADTDEPDQSLFSDDDEPDTTANETSQTTVDTSAGDASMLDPFSDNRGRRREFARTPRSAAGVLEDGHQRTFRVPPTYRDVELDE